MHLASRAAALHSSDLVQWFTLFIQRVSPAPRKRGILLNKVCKAEFPPVELHIECGRLVIVLSCSGRPLQVAAFISFVIVDPVNFEFLFECFVNVTDCSHVVDECNGVLELLTEIDSSGAVMAELTVCRLVASAANSKPLASYPLIDFIRHPPPHVLYNLLS